MWKLVRKSSVLIIVFLICILLLGLFLYLKKPEGNLALEVDELVRVHCPIQNQTCLIHLSNGVELELSLSPHGLPALKPLTLQLSSSQIDFQKLTYFSAIFEGRDMEMGKHSLAVSPTLNSNVLIAKGLIPLCPMDPMMVWVLNVTYQYQNKVTLLKLEVPSDPH